MYKLFKKRLNSDLKIYFEERGFQYYKDNIFLGIHKDLVFVLYFDKVGYGTRIGMSFGIGVPVVKNDFVDYLDNLDRFAYEGYSLGSAKWELNNGLNIEIKKKKIDEYIDEIKYIYANYIFYFISKEINAFQMEEHVRDEYDNLFSAYLSEIGEEDPSWLYTIDFMNSGKSQDEWTEEDGKKCDMLVKEKQDNEFPYEEKRVEILKRVEENRLLFQDKLKEVFGESIKTIEIDTEICPVVLKDIFDISNILEVISNYNFIQNYNVNTNGRIDHGETYYFQKGNNELLVILSKDLFLEFIINPENHKKTKISVYDGGYFWFGWLVGKPNVMKENINEALEHLASVLSTID